MAAIPLHTESPIHCFVESPNMTLFDADSTTCTDETISNAYSMEQTSYPMFTIPEYHPSRQGTPVKGALPKITTNSYIPPHIPLDETSPSTVTTPATPFSPPSPRSDQPSSAPSTPYSSAPPTRHHSVAVVPQMSSRPNIARHYSVATSSPQKPSNLRTSSMSYSPKGKYLPSMASPVAMDLSNPPGYQQNVAESFADRELSLRGQASPGVHPQNQATPQLNYTPFYANNEFSATSASRSTGSSVSESPNRRAGRGLGILDNDPSIYLPTRDENGNIIEDSTITGSLWETAAKLVYFAGQRFSAGEKELRRVLGQGIRTGSFSSADDGF